MKKILAIAAAAALTAGVSAFAANPFSDVSTDDWAYQAVADLSDQGVVEGYPDGTFKGERNVTRYEIAQIVARLMAKEDQLNAEQQATLNKLAGEYADELANLGVRVSNLEKKVGNIYWSGDARMRYQSKDNSADENWDGRMRINVKSQVNESTTINGRLTTNMNYQSVGTDGSNTYMDVLNVKHQFGKNVAVTLGRYANNFGNQGGWLYGDSHNFDGAEVSAKFGKVNVAVGYGQFNAGSTDWKDTTGYTAPLAGVDHTAVADMTENTLKDQDVFYAKADADFGAFDLYANYYSNQESNPNEDFNIWGVGLNVPISGFRVFGEYWQNTAAPDALEDTAWNAGIGYGKRDLKKAGSWSLDVAYNEVGAGVYLGGTGLQTDILDSLWKISDAAPIWNSNFATNNYSEGEWDYTGANKVKFWNAIAEVTLAKNTYLHAEYAFAAEADKGDDPDDTWTVSLNYVF